MLTLLLEIAYKVFFFTSTYENTYHVANFGNHSMDLGKSKSRGGKMGGLGRLGYRSKV